MANSLTFASVQNKAGNFIEPTLEGTTAAAENATINDDLTFFLGWADGDDAYPIAAQTWIIAYTTQADAAKAEAIRGFLTYLLTDGQETGRRRSTTRRCRRSGRQGAGQHRQDRRLTRSDTDHRRVGSGLARVRSDPVVPIVHERTRMAIAADLRTCRPKRQPRSTASSGCRPWPPAR